MGAAPLAAACGLGSDVERPACGLHDMVRCGVAASRCSRDDGACGHGAGPRDARLGEVDESKAKEPKQKRGQELLADY